MGLEHRIRRTGRVAEQAPPRPEAEPLRARQVASPRHADVALVTGPVTRNTAEPLRRAVAALPQPALVTPVPAARATRRAA
jgi:Ni,Fe-hydrogenase III small subunit